MDIFGQNAKYYKLFLDAAPNMTETQLRTALARGGRKINWDVNLAPRVFKDDAEALTAAFGLLSNNLQAIQGQSDEILYRSFVVKEFIPINTSLPEGVTSKSINIVSKHGKSKFINKDGSNVERAEASVNRVSFPISYGGIVASWSLQELRESIFMGIPLGTTTIQAAIDACNNHIQDVAFTGDTDSKFTGLLNSASVPVYGSSVPNFLTASGDDLVAFINQLISAIGNATKEIFYREFRRNDLIVALPTLAFDGLGRRLSSTSERTIMDYISKQNVWTARTGKSLVFKSLPEATGMGASGSDRLVVYPMDSRVLEMDMPIAPRTTRVINEAYSVNAPYEYSISALNVKRGSLMFYADGVTG